MDVQFTLIHCCQCHMPFTITTDFYNKLLACHNHFYCPQGHAQHFGGESDAERERRLRRTAEGERDALAAEVAKLKRRKSVKATAKPKKDGKR